MQRVKLDTTAEDFKPQPIIKGSPVEHEEIYRNIRASVEFDLPVFEKETEPREGSFIFVAGGPTLKEFLPEIKTRFEAGEFIMTSNHTHDFLISGGIIPTACLIMDPKEKVKKYVKNVSKTTIYYVAVVCHKEVFANLLKKEAKIIKLCTAYGIEDQSDIDLQLELYKKSARHFLVGGTMTPLRAMTFATQLGFKKVEFYGFDSCFSTKEPNLVYENDLNYKKALYRNGGVKYIDQQNNLTYVIDEGKQGGFFYAYKKTRGENITVVEIQAPPGWETRRFLTNETFGNQARQICKWVDKLEGVATIDIHGDSLSSWTLKVHRENQRIARESIGDRRWTEEYENLQHQMHTKGDYGVNGGRNAELACKAIVPIQIHLPHRLVRVLDYGCGSGQLGTVISHVLNSVKITNYDPFHPQWKNDRDPGEHDVTLCMDVMEHVEIQCVDNTLKYIAHRTKYVAVFSIALSEASKILPNGRNAHITLRPMSFWKDKLEDHGFAIGEAGVLGHNAIFVCQKVESKENIERELRVA